MQVTAIIAAGGRGRRFGGALPKQLLEVGGRAILDRSVSAFLAHPEVSEVIVALPREIVQAPPLYLGAVQGRLRLVPGGLRRQDSVRTGFAAAAETSDVIVVHDGARPFPSAALISRTIAAAAESGAALAALAAQDTVKRAARGGSALSAAGYPVVAETLAREAIYLAQTPQAFRRDILREALELSDADATDEAALVERTGYAVRLVEGESTNIKITTPGDLPFAEVIARGAIVDPCDHRSIVRVGTGYDLHRLVEGRPLVLGGVTIPSERGLLGHSDADAICHALTDAVLGAAAAGDIGQHFPDSDGQWRDASSLELLRQAVGVVRAAGFVVVNADVIVVAERPRLGPYIHTMRTNIAGALGIGPGDVSIKGKTNEGLGEIGRGEAIATHAVAALSVRTSGR